MVKGQGHLWPSKFKGQGQTHWSHLRPGVQSICLLIIWWQSDHIWLRYRKFHIWPWQFKVKVKAKVKPEGHIWGLGVQSICLLFVLWQSNHFWLRYRKFYIWLWKFKVKVMANVKPAGDIWAQEFNRYVCFSFRGNGTILGWNIAWPWKSKVKVMVVTFELYSSINMFAFCVFCVWFHGNLTIFGWDIANSIFDLEKSRSRSWQKSTKI